MNLFWRIFAAARSKHGVGRIPPKWQAHWPFPELCYVNNRLHLVLNEIKRRSSDGCWNAQLSASAVCTKACAYEATA